MTPSALPPTLGLVLAGFGLIAALALFVAAVPISAPVVVSSAIGLGASLLKP